jgi:hypothetical protein
MPRQHESYVLWLKSWWKDWTPFFTVSAPLNDWPSPLDVIKQWMNHWEADTEDSHWQRGKTWMIKPEGEKPAELLRQEDAS